MRELRSKTTMSCSCMQLRPIPSAIQTFQGSSRFEEGIAIIARLAFCQNTEPQSLKLKLMSFVVTGITKVKLLSLSPMCRSTLELTEPKQPWSKVWQFPQYLLCPVMFMPLVTLGQTQKQYISLSCTGKPQLLFVTALELYQIQVLQVAPWSGGSTTTRLFWTEQPQYFPVTTSQVTPSTIVMLGLGLQTAISKEQTSLLNLKDQRKGVPVTVRLWLLPIARGSPQASPSQSRIIIMEDFIVLDLKPGSINSGISQVQIELTLHEHSESELGQLKMKVTTHYSSQTNKEKTCLQRSWSDFEFYISQVKQFYPGLKMPSLKELTKAELAPLEKLETKQKVVLQIANKCVHYVFKRDINKVLSLFETLIFCQQQPSSYQALKNQCLKKDQKWYHSFLPSLVGSASAAPSLVSEIKAYSFKKFNNLSQNCEKLYQTYSSLRQLTLFGGKEDKEMELLKHYCLQFYRAYLLKLFQLRTLEENLSRIRQKLVSQEVLNQWKSDYSFEEQRLQRSLAEIDAKLFSQLQV